MAAARTRDTTYLGVRYQRLVPRLGKKKAIVAVEHSILTAVWHMLTHDVDYPQPERGLLHPARSRPRPAPHHPPSQHPGIHRPLQPHPRRLAPPHTPTAPAGANQIMTCGSPVVFGPGKVGCHPCEDPAEAIRREVMEENTARRGYLPDLAC